MRLRFGCWRPPAPWGGRLNLVDNARDLNAPMEIASRSLLSNIEDVDFTAAVSRLSLETFVLEATQQSFVRVASLNLFNLL
jgi:flagellar hook-associated protein 3 FlgL